MTVVLGLDLSLRATGIVVVPVVWGLNWQNVYSVTCGRSLTKQATEAEKAQRLQHIRHMIRGVVQAYRPTIAVIEQYAFSAMASQAHSLGELGGVIKLELLELHVPFEIVSPASARRLYGKQPRKGAKDWAAAKLYAAGAPKSWTLDQLDAFTIANWKLAEHGAALMLSEAA